MYEHRESRESSSLLVVGGREGDIRCVVRTEGFLWVEVEFYMV